MYEQQQQQHFVDLQSDSGFGDDSSWLAGDDDLRLSPHQSAAGANSGNENLDRRLLKDLVEMVPLIEQFMKDKSSFKRRGSMVYTKMPSKESLSRRGRNASQTVPGRKKRDAEGNSDAVNDAKEVGDNAKALAGAEKDELTRLREQVNDLQTKLSEKEEVLKSVEISKRNQVNEIQVKLDESKRLVAEKETLIKSMQLQLSDTKIKLADRQAALEKTQWEAKTTGTKAIKLQEQLDSVEGEIASFACVFETLAKPESKKLDRDYDPTPYQFDHLPYLDDVDDTELRKMEDARLAYVAAVTTAKQREDEESLAMAAKARAYLQSLAFKY
ncbi:protein MICROTUBULE BINDING PROTEIN 2C isoform X2 [Raphanus sativus]|uniref:Protein MICROTUBULE BINDING PROTEIN 2C isoform X2 n=1 Tax=Raphanus sativus TaxID=3726 RepID=A0A6J0KDU7_RAPSA|nr:protein MICROTUBULE BINDING PROTEIN 2C isoform X2 [Raphanus sativus]